MFETFKNASLALLQSSQDPLDIKEIDIGYTDKYGRMGWNYLLY